VGSYLAKRVSHPFSGERLGLTKNTISGDGCGGSSGVTRPENFCTLQASNWKYGSSNMAYPPYWNLTAESMLGILKPQGVGRASYIQRDDKDQTSEFWIIHPKALDYNLLISLQS